MKVPPFVKRSHTRLKDERGSSIVELAIVFPILLLLFVGVAELGRLFYTYTTLAKATKMGARFLTTEKDAEISPTNPNYATIVASVKLRAASLVVCGFEDCTPSNRPSVVKGLATSNVQVTLPNTTPGFIGPRYVKVEIIDFNFQPLVFNIAGATDSTSSTFYFSLQPSTEMRYMH
jgi:Flp pilus assembly protein TadG